MIFALPQMLAAAAISIIVAGGLGFWSGYGKGRAAGEEAVQARWDAERVSQYQQIEKARREAALAERAAERALDKQREVYDEELQRRAVAAAAAGRELQRLRDALATAAIGRRERPQTQGTGPAPDDPAAAAGKLLGACAEALVRMGDDARSLAAQVIGLQSYSRTAQEVCGR